MRFFVDRSGLSWQIVIGRESWGNHVALIVPVNREGPMRALTLRAVAADAAQAEIDALDQAGLQKLLDESRVRDEP